MIEILMIIVVIPILLVDFPKINKKFHLENKQNMAKMEGVLQKVFLLKIRRLNKKVLNC
jgi:hypothetical protein